MATRTKQAPTTEYHAAGKMYVIGNATHTKWLAEVDSTVDAERESVADRFSQALRFPDVKTARDKIKMNQGLPRSSYAAGSRGKRLYDFWKEATPFTMIFKLRDVRRA